MKNLITGLFIIISIAACSQKQEAPKSEIKKDEKVNTPSASTVSQPSSVKLHELFTKADAESIMGEPVHVTDSTMGSQQGITAYKSTYVTNAGGAKQGSVYFLAEEFSKIPDAQTKYSFIKAANENSAGFKLMNDLGDEGYFHSDNEKFYFIMARKGTRVVTFKVNKITPKTSLDNFNKVARDVIAKL